MPDKKLTDNEIVKALEEHYKQVDKGYSTHLEYGGKGDEHEEKYIYMLRDVLDLINRLQAENERLCMELDEVIIAKDLLFDEAEALIKKTKTEAYKEFAERLKEKSKQGRGYLGNVYHSVDVAEIDNLLKEIIGE